ncbi:JmjC domain-containing protein [Kribbella sindirgiensis]|uniref:JmjC domain-containing protein n=1 Tax=Kribbella sindirgiensis TaxID=1124744 RepID=UPI0013F3B63C|nr:cupin domain-containing protein [Kribbella sindirgiensis]
MDSNLLASLVDDSDQFIAEHWLESPYLGRSKVTDPAALLSIAELNKILTSTALRGPHIRVMKRGRPVARQDYLRMFQTTADYIPDRAEPNLVIGEFASGATLVIDRVEDFALSVREACDSLAHSLATTMRAHAFITPPGETGFQAHHDPLGAFIVQVHGEKLWRIYSRMSTASVGRIYPSDGEGRALDLGDPIIETTLRPGDVLYLPQGFPHVATAPDVLSVHITMVCQTPDWAALVRPLVDEVLNSTEFLQIPNLLTTDSTSLHQTQLTRVADFTRQLAEKAGHNRTELGVAPTDTSSVLTKLEILARLPAEEIRIAALPTLQELAGSETHDALEVEGAIIKLPAAFRPALRLILQNQECLLSELVDAIGRRPALSLISRLAIHEAVSVADRRGEGRT